MKNYLKLQKLAEQLDWRTPNQYFQDIELFYLKNDLINANKLFNELNLEGQQTFLEYLEIEDAPIYIYFEKLMNAN